MDQGSVSNEPDDLGIRLGTPDQILYSFKKRYYHVEDHGKSTQTAFLLLKPQF